jgi:hypothetical protein
LEWILWPVSNCLKGSGILTEAHLVVITTVGASFRWACREIRGCIFRKYLARMALDQSDGEDEDTGVEAE